jgi:hypothetical protein
MFYALAGCDYLTDSDAQTIRNMIAFHARIGLEHISHYMRLYLCRYAMPLALFCVVHLGDVLVNVCDILLLDVVASSLMVMERNRAGLLYVDRSN